MGIPKWVIRTMEGIAALFLIAAVGLYIEGWVNYRDAANWEVVKGQVVSTDVEVVSSSSGTGSKREESVSYDANVRYTYTFNGRKWEGEQTVLNNEVLYSSDEEAMEFLSDYPVRQPVDVHVNPADPQQAVLIVNPPDLIAYLLVAFFGLMFAGAGLLMSRMK
jgi:Protein of unknown function (DUF3592)